MEFQEEKQAFNARAKASMRKFLRSKTWEEKVESIERMREASKLAREGYAASQRWAGPLAAVGGAPEPWFEIRTACGLRNS